MMAILWVVGMLGGWAWAAYWFWRCRRLSHLLRKATTETAMHLWHTGYKAGFRAGMPYGARGLQVASKTPEELAALHAEERSQLRRHITYEQYERLIHVHALEAKAVRDAQKQG